MNQLLEQSAQDYRRIEQAITYLEAHFQEQPDLDEIAGAVHLSKYHFQRLFKRWAGVSPTQFLQALTLDYAKERLAANHSVLDAALDAGLSGPGRLHDLFITHEAVTPGQYKHGGAELAIRFGSHPTPFGRCLLAVTDRGICALRFVDDEATTLAELQQEWPGAHWLADQAGTAPLVRRIFDPSGVPDGRPFHLYLQGTNFQIQVWRALLAVPRSALVSYQDVAAYLGRPQAGRAVGAAVARNPIGYLIPCHRVINKGGQAHRYRWGAARKKAMIGYEAVASAAVRPQTGAGVT
jgi:AraC family transcriptional regulator, regulatory protein of adaptative response / methylated-DNA-[protein]-cysteine methyltransferase